MKSAVIRVCLGKSGLSVFPQLGAFEVLHGVGGQVQFLPIEPLDNIELDFDYPDEGITGPAVPGISINESPGGLNNEKRV